MSLNCEFLVTSNRERFLTVQLALAAKNIPHRIHIRSYPSVNGGKNATLFTILTDETHRHFVL